MNSRLESTGPKTVKEAGWTRKEIFKMVMEARSEGHLSVSIVSDGPRYAQDKWIPEDLRLIGVFSPIYKKGIRRN